MGDRGSALDESNDSFALELGGIVGLCQYCDIYLGSQVSGLNGQDAVNSSNVHIHGHCPLRRAIEWAAIPSH